MANYSTISTECPKDSYMGVVPQENIRYTLKSNGSKVDALYTFANGNLRMIHVLESEGSPQLTKTAIKPVHLGNATLQVVDVIATARNFLNDYTSYSGKSFYRELASMLENVDANRNSTKTTGNVKLEVNVSRSSTVFRWTYTFNGIEAPDKCVAIGYQNGFLKYFIDNWDLYKIGSTKINLSEKEAIDIAMERARTFSWNMSSDNDTVKISGFTVTNGMIWENVFCSNLYADKPRSDDPLMLYPVRHVWVSLDKFYPGNVYGFNVYVWADTGEVCAIHERISTMDPPADLVATTDEFTVESSSDLAFVDGAKSDSISLTVIALPVFAVVMLGPFPVWILVSKNKNLPKRGVFKVGGLMLCLLISSTLLLIPISAVDALPTRRALIWGSESTGAWNSTLGFSWRKHPDEVYRQSVTSNAIYNYFRDDGYDTKNYQGDGSNASQILANISDSASQYSLVAVVDFDHGIGRIDSPNGAGEFHYMFEDNNGTIWGPDNKHKDYHPEHGVYDMDIYSQTASGKNFFTFLSACMSANIDEWEMEEPPGSGIYYPVGQGFEYTTYAQGMPFAWTHRTVVDKDTPGFTTSLNMSIDGYNEPDGGAFCYIGFPYGSAALSQTITGISPIYATWLENFFWYALSFDISVNDALDEASLSNFDDLFGNTDLATGFTAVWPMYYDGYWHYSGPGITGPGTLAVYGNGNMHLYQYFVHDYVDATWYGYYAGVDNPDGIEGGSNDDSYTYLYAVGWYGDQAVITGSIGWEAKGHIYLYGCTDPGYSSHVEVWVSYDYSNWYPVNEDLWVSQTSPGWIDVGSYASNFRYIAVVVYADQAPSTLYIDSVLVIPQPQQSSPHYWVSSVVSTTIYGYGQIHNPTGLNHSYNDGSYVQLYGGNYGDGAGIVGAMNGDAHGHIYLYGYSATGYYTHLYVYVSYNGNDWYQPSVPVQTVSYADGIHWIDCGSYGSSFRYIKIVAIDDNGMSACLNVDSVKVVP